MSQFAMPLGLDFKKINAQVLAQKARLKASENAPLVKPARPDYSGMSHFDLKLIRDRFEAKTDWTQKKSELAAREFELEASEEELTNFLPNCGPNDRKRILEKRETVRAELASIGEQMPTLVRCAQLYLWERENLPTLQEVRAAFDRERKESDRLR
jgi:hypothetical protein